MAPPSECLMLELAVSRTMATAPALKTWTFTWQASVVVDAPNNGRRRNVEDLGVVVAHLIKGPMLEYPCQVGNLREANSPSTMALTTASKAWVSMRPAFVTA